MPRGWRKKKDVKRTPLFGASLQDILARQQSEGKDGDVPVVVTRCIDRLDLDLDTDGIFRQAGNIARKNKLKETFDEEGDCVLDEAGVHDVASILKQFLRELAEPPMTYELAEEFIAAQKTEGAERTSELMRLMACLPVENCTLIATLAAFIMRVAVHEDVNRMGVDNLALVFAPNLLRFPETGDPQADMRREMQETPSITGVLVTIVKEADEVLSCCPSWAVLRESTPLGSGPTASGPANDDAAAVAALASGKSITETPATPNHSGDNANVSIASVATAPSPALSPGTEKQIGDAVSGSVAKALFIDTGGADSGKGYSELDPEMDASTTTHPPEGLFSRGLATMVADDDDATGNSTVTHAGGSAQTDVPWSVADIPLLEVECRRLGLDIEVFESNFQRAHGRKPAGAERADIARAESLRNSFQSALEKLYRDRDRGVGGGGSANDLTVPSTPKSGLLPGGVVGGGRGSTADVMSPPPTEEVITAILKDPLGYANARLAELREADGRPEPIELCTLLQLADEKSAIKRELRAFDVAFETRHGHPPHKNDKEGMRPLYERYKFIRGILDQHPEIGDPDKARAAPAQPAAASPAAAVAGPSAAPSNADLENAPIDTSIPLEENEEYNAVKAEKRNLQVKLHKYQRDFMARYGRRVQYVEDRMPVQDEYLRYKALKARLSEFSKAYGLEPGAED